MESQGCLVASAVEIAMMGKFAAANAVSGITRDEKNCHPKSLSHWKDRHWIIYVGNVLPIQMDTSTTKLPRGGWR